MKIGSRPTEYPMDFSRIDNPVEAALLPLPGLDAKTLQGKHQGHVKTLSDGFEYSSRAGFLKTETGYTRQGITTKVKLEKSRFSRKPKAIKGRVGESEVDLTIKNLEGDPTWKGSFEVEGKIGEIEIRQTVNVDMDNWLTSDPVMTKKGTIDGLDYEEKYYQRPLPRYPLSSCTISKGHLGEMPIERRVLRASPESQKGDGKIGVQEFDEFLRKR